MMQLLCILCHFFFKKIYWEVSHKLLINEPVCSIGGISLQHYLSILFNIKSSYFTININQHWSLDRKEIVQSKTDVLPHPLLRLLLQQIQRIKVPSESSCWVKSIKPWCHGKSFLEGRESQFWQGNYHTFSRKLWPFFRKSREIKVSLYPPGGK